MVNEPHRRILLPNRTYQAIVRSEIKKIAVAAGFTPKRIAELEIVVAELTSNVIKHAANGAQFLVKILRGDRTGIEIICIDSGPGIESVSRVMEDGISSTSTLGQGLGAIRRLSDEFDAYSLKGWGTIVLARLFNKQEAAAGRKNVDMGIVMLAKEGEECCGDNYAFMNRGNSLKFAICDGLGHGKDAAMASEQCLVSFHSHIMLSPMEQVRRIHVEAKKTRGAVMHIIHIDFTNKQVLYCGIGNISAKICSPGRSKSCVSYNGIVGYSVPGSINNHTTLWAKNDLLIMHSDGLSTRWDLQKYPLITRHDRTIIAAALYKDFCRGTDDITIAVIGQHNKTA